MWNGDLDAARSAVGSPDSAAARVVVNTAALGRNLERALAAAPDGALLDARFAGWGHSARAVIDAAVTAGVRRIHVDRSARGIAVPDTVELVGADTAGTRPVESRETVVLSAEAVYGLPTVGSAGSGAEPVMTMVGTVLLTKDLRAGEGVSYGYTHRAPEDTRIALVTGGYGQGVPRAVGNHAEVRIGTAACRILGRVAMDVCVVEIADAPVTVGADAVFFGDPAHGDPSLAQWCAITGWSAGEIVTGTAGARRVIR